MSPTGWRALGVATIVAFALTATAPLSAEDPWQLIVGTGGTLPAGFDGSSMAVTSAQVFDDALYLGTWGYGGCQVWRTTDGVSFAKVTSDGFGSAGNSEIPAMAVFEGQLYAGSSNWNYGGDSGARLWRTANGTSWELVSSPGFGDPAAGHLRSLAEFNGYLYAGLLQTQTVYQPPNDVWRVQIWRSSSGNPGTWSLAYEFADVTSNYNAEAAEALVVFENQLYCVLTPWEWGPTRLIRTSNGTDWSEVSDFGWQCDTFSGLSDNPYASAAVLHGHIYLSSFDSHGYGGPICRSEDGAVWEPVTVPGGWVTTVSADRGVLHVGLPSGGVLQSVDGLAWDSLGPSALYDPAQALATFGRSLYLGTRNIYGGCEVWRDPVLDPCFVDGFESSNTSAWSGSMP